MKKTIAVTSVVALLSISACTDDDTSSSATQFQSLTVQEDTVEIRGVIDIQDGTLNPSDISLALRWVIPDGPYPAHPISTSLDLMPSQDTGTFLLNTGLTPPQEALQENEANQTSGFAVAYLVAYIDTNNNGILDCQSPSCADIFVGASPNTVVVFHESGWPDDGPPAFSFTPDSTLRPPQGWSLVYLEPSACEQRPRVRSWSEQDQIELTVIGDFRGKDRCQVRAINPDLD